MKKLDEVKNMIETEQNQISTEVRFLKVSNGEFAKKVFGTFVVLKNYVIERGRYSSSGSHDYLLIGLKDNYNLISTMGNPNLIIV